MALAQMVEASHTPATAVTAATPRRAAAGVSSGAATANSTLSSQPQGGYARPTSLPRRRRLRSARFQILLLELSGATLLLLDEPTDNLDLVSAEALEEGLAAFDGTVVGVTHDRWFARGFDRFLVFGADGEVYESDEPVWDEGRVSRQR